MGFKGTSVLAFHTAIGRLEISWTPVGISGLDLIPEAGDEIGADVPPWVQDSARRITRYLEGEALDLGDLPLDLEGVPAFPRRVYDVLRRTRRGGTITYGQVALLAGSPGAARAVGQVLKRNPLPILVPCHRVVAANGPGGFSLLGGLETKELLLALESGSGASAQPEDGQNRAQA